MTNVARLEEYRPHMHGRCVCLNCRHQWEGVAPIGSVWLECPACSLDRGRFLHNADRGEAKRWTCTCGNDLFHITPDETYCPNCGATQAGFSE